MTWAPTDAPNQDREFTDRENQLPADQSDNTTIDQNRNDANRDAANETPLGSPSMDFDVRSTYDVRPINGYDFNEVAINDSGEGTLSSPSTASFEVPFGFTGVLRRVRVWIEPTPGFIYPSESLLTIQQNGNDVNDNIDIPYGDGSEWIDCFVIADELQTLGVKLTWASGALPIGSVMYLHAYGNYLLKTGRPANFEIANPVGVQRRAAPPVQQLPPPQMSTPLIVAPTQIPRVADPTETGIAKPPFMVEWTRMNLLSSSGRSRAAPAGNWTPVKIVGGKRLSLSADEMLAYRNFLAATRPR